MAQFFCVACDGPLADVDIEEGELLDAETEDYSDDTVTGECEACGETVKAYEG